MPPQIHIYDLLAIVGLTWLALWGWRAWSRRRAPAKPAPGRWGMFAVAVPVLFLMAHVWAFIRPIEVFVEATRYMRAHEREMLRKGWGSDTPEALDLLEYMLKVSIAGEYVPLALSKGRPITTLDVWRIRASLAWGSWLPRMPKFLVVSDCRGIQTDPDGIIGVTGYYRWRQHRQNMVHFHNRYGGWTAGGIDERKPCVREPTDGLTKFLDYSPIDFLGYGSTF